MGSQKKRRDIPRFEHPIIETHCHLDYLDAEQLEETIERSRAVGIERIVTIAVSPDNLATVMGLAHEHSQIWCTQGIHPHEAELYNDTVEATITANASDSRVVAIGEIGLDYFYDHADRNVQCRVFEAQLALAVEQDLPVVIHTREADADTRAILENFSSSLQRKGVIHSFTSGLELAEYCLSEGFCLGFNGITTFNKADNVREVVSATPLEQILLETDAPYLTPVPYRGKPNAPYYLPFIAEKLAAVKDCPVEELLQIAWQNSCQVFDFD
ncbi:TatD family deoxyribonuclease [Halieaceae bacterium IMCC14734]|uniref:TatD family deoxyribonuclease n=1 Tax=Candidatus Litorirhabdus singularis TaxID=2518993 RepID=A0ABT3TGT6_9GAMM|nr:TatD family hydrolase [Candidatus Litorirhabdus singularis]MCX2981535.1 TatD family deoxyribonuclease [Candidatus Litorirhabdus singularis]